MTTEIIIRFNLEGFHNWPDAKEVFPEVSFLSDRHRHIFHFECRAEVKHDDRDIEIIMFKRTVIDWLYMMYSQETPKEGYAYNYLEFGAMSCEMIAKELIKQFDLTYCSVLEDNENGSVVRK